MITVERLRELLRYNRTTGVFTWKKDRRCGIHGNGYAARAGDVAGTVNRKGYISIAIDDKDYLGHRLAWFYVIGEWPTEQIDHRNRIKADNRWANLRHASNTLNQQNRARANKNSKTGLLGVVPRGVAFRARITVAGRTRTLGTFKTAHEAHQAYIRAKRDLHPGGLQ